MIPGTHIIHPSLNKPFEVYILKKNLVLRTFVCYGINNSNYPRGKQNKKSITLLALHLDLIVGPKGVPLNLGQNYATLLFAVKNRILM